MKKITLLIVVVFVLFNLNTVLAEKTEKATDQNPLVDVFTKTGVLSVENFQKMDKESRTLYIAGFWDGLGVATAVTRVKRPSQWYINMSENSAGATPHQLEAVVSGYLDRHPEKWHHSLNTLCVEALWESFGKKQ